ncbi:MAG: GNAT family N-acetyltransferase [Treponema sp.]|jgi:GNAT superfamily N-acetyltransferase|nr:GNAT family N-acetyltransferase [Treponema sp.]
MQFELSEALIKDLLFSMEDQMGEFFLDTQDGVIIGQGDEGFAKAAAGENRYIPLPGWDSSDGFRLMEHFAAGLRNLTLRNELSAALNRGKGVFRAFKDIISHYPETEKLWFSYKERGMRREILRWYNGLREEWGLERIGGEPEETGDLVLEDFRFRPFAKDDNEAAAALHRRCIEESRSYAADHELGDAGLPQGEGHCRGEAPIPGDLALAVETGDGDFAGFIAASRQGHVLYINALEVRSEYRGLGIGEGLLARFIEQARRQFAPKPGAKNPLQILIDLPAGSEGFSQVLYRDSFKPYTVRYCLRTD